MNFKFRNVFILTLIFALAAALLTNPKKDSYVSWIQEKATEESTNTFEKGLLSLVTGPFIQNSTQSKNYVVFSIYETTFRDEKMKVLGIFNNFIPLSSDEKPDDDKKQGA
jgi:hypothetical protein